MFKTSLPTILLKGNILFPKNELKLEFDSELSKNIISESEYFYDNKLLISSTINKLEQEPQAKDLSPVGVVSKIIHKIDLPNGKTRVIIKGMYRVNIYEYLNLENVNEILEAIISTPTPLTIDPKEEEIFLKKLWKELEDFIHDVPYISNSFLAEISTVTSLEEITDLIVPNLSLSFDRLLEYLNEINCMNRCKMILEDIYKEKEKFAIEKSIDSKIKQGIENTQKQYLLRAKIEELKKELGEFSENFDDNEVLKEKIENLDAPNEVKNRLFEEVRKYETNSSLEAPIVRNYIEYLLKLPWNKKTKDCDDLSIVLSSLNQIHFGMDEVKDRIIEYLAVKKMSKNVKGPILCLVGPPGIGKTTLAYNISKSLGRKFVKISLGGVNDPAEIVGHRRTYLGAEPGRIVQGLKRCQTNNPVFLIDEIDKMGKDIKGDPANALLEVLDPIQNKHFSDHYIEEEINLSDIMFIVTANNIEAIPALLKDRLEIIELNGYTEYEKLEICRRHIIPRICREHELNPEFVTFTDDTILEIIRNYTKEAGVRELERKVSKIIRKIVKTIVTYQVKVSSIKITPDNLEKYLGKRRKKVEYPISEQSGIANSLAWTPNGGEVYPIEAVYFPGKGNLILTGNVGSELQESALVAVNYLKTKIKEFSINKSELLESDIHIHIPGFGLKNGSSIGIALTTAILSSLKKQVILKDIAMTGEITLLGNILPVGNIIEKIEGAVRGNIKYIFVPIQNQEEVSLLPLDILEKIEIIFVGNYEEVFRKIEQLAK